MTTLRMLWHAATDFHGRPFPVYVDAESILRILDQEQQS